MDFHVAGAFELFEDDFIHARTGINSAVARMVSEPPSSMLRAAPKKLGFVQRVGIDTAGEKFYLSVVARCCKRGQDA